MQRRNRLSLWWRFLVFWSLGLGIGVASWTAAQEDSGAAHGDFGPVPQVQPSNNTVPGPVPISPPIAPSAPTRPNSWPADAPSSKPGNKGPAKSSKEGGISLSSIPYTDTPAAKDVASDSSFLPCEGAQIIARVGSEVVLAYEVMEPVNAIIESHKNEIPPEQVEEFRKHQILAALKQLIDVKLIYANVKQELPKEALTRIENSLDDHYENKEVEKLLQQAHLNSRDELDAKLRKAGSSLAHTKRAFIESSLAHEWVQQRGKFEGEVTNEEVLAYYREHPAEFENQARARWEELMARFSKYPDKNAAWNAISKMGNEVQQGKPFAAVAKEMSDGVTAANGGLQDWTTKGSLVSQELDQAIFGLPVGELSQIIETKLGLHIVRVVERKDASRTPYVDAQVKIRKKIHDQKDQEQFQAFVDKLKKQTVVTTIFDNPQQSGLSTSPLR